LQLIPALAPSCECPCISMPRAATSEFWEAYERRLEAVELGRAK
jgi:hypothetical protein